MNYLDSAHPEHAPRPCNLSMLHDDGRVDVVVTDPDGSTFVVERALLVKVGGTPPPHDLYVQE